MMVGQLSSHLKIVMWPKTHSKVYSVVEFIIQYWWWFLTLALKIMLFWHNPFNWNRMIMMMRTLNIWIKWIKFWVMPFQFVCLFDIVCLSFVFRTAGCCSGCCWSLEEDSSFEFLFLHSDVDDFFRARVDMWMPHTH